AGLIQRRELARLLQRAAGTEIGRTHNFARLAALPAHELPGAFRAEVPSGDYEAFRARLARMRENAEPNVLWPGVVRDWAQTSGTTGAGGQKYIPVSAEMMRSNRRAAFDIFAHAARMGVSLPHVYAGRLLFLGGSTDLETNAHGVRTGDLSGVVTRLITWPLTEVVAPSADIALMSHWPSKIDAMARQTAEMDVRFISGMASWSLVLFEKVLALARAKNPSVRSLRDVWPNLTLFAHGGVNYAPFDARVRESWSGDPTGDLPYRLEVYPASEGFIAMQDTRGDPSLRLNTDIGVYYEFVPLEEIDRPDARSFACDQVEKGQRYVVVMTTCAGLWRYIIGDTVVFDSVGPLAPPRLRIVGRHKAFINAFGENLIVEDIETAVVEAARATRVTVGEFTAAPVYPGPGRRSGVELAVEWAAPDFSPNSPAPDPKLVERFAQAFDQTLRDRGTDYNIKRTGDLGMGPAVVTPLPVGAFHAWMASRGKLGGQHKAPRCANNRAVLDDVVAAGRRAPAPAPPEPAGTHP
ncbi:MAG: GH3 auxin-responsive promoter family protein, partial [Planctomycetes bacterium]|nr:GH3 auxin-responsive promoter family protein [Planctomycetota bacterium]